MSPLRWKQKLLKSKDSELNDYTVCLWNISNNISVDNMKTGLNEYVSKFSVDNRSIDVDEKKWKRKKVK